MVTPWDKLVDDAIGGYELQHNVKVALRQDMIALMYQAYLKGRVDGTQSEREYPYREDMGR